jgi:DUF1680 family protein
VAAASGDTTYIPALDRLWDDVIFKKMYITGGIGSSYANEGFSGDYDLPNEEAYCETCASVGMVLWNQRMNMLKGDGKYIDIVERSMYNGALAGISLSADLFFYVNPLASAGKHHRQPWYGTACCPSQISRFLPSIGSYIYASSPDGVIVNLFVRSETSVKVDDTEVKVKQATDYPWDGAVKIKVSPQKTKNFKLQIRKPGWCNSYSLKINGIDQDLKENALQYLVIDREWSKNDEVVFDMDMPVEVVSSDPNVKANIGKRAIQRGPVVYCAEETDNPDFDKIKVGKDTKFTNRFDANLLKGIVSITAGNSDNNTFTLIPYYAWDNRTAGKMKVWVDYVD